MSAVVETRTTVKHEGSRWVVYSSDGRRTLGVHSTELMAREQRDEIEKRVHRSAVQGELRELHLRSALGKARTEVIDGREHLVIPVVALMQGVIHAVNAETPEFVSVDTLSRAASSWNGRPVTLGHPKKDGKQCSALEDVALASHIGFIRNSHVVGTKMLQEACIDSVRTKSLHPEMYKRLLEGGTEEVSVGAMVLTDKKPGIWEKTKQYMASWLETIGDHLAFLPGGRGACSVEMGCGTHRAAMHLVTAEEFKVLNVFDTPSEAASEEAAELITYQTIATLLDNVGTTFEEAKSAVEKLIADEKENPTETPAEETAETEVETARLEAIQTYCNAMATTLSHVSSLISHMLYPVTPAMVGYAGKMKECVACKGTGSLNGNPCEACDGKGELKVAAGARHSASDMKTIQMVHDHSVTLGASCDRGLRDASNPEIRSAGDVSGHEFHGNQWTTGGGTAHTEAHKAASDAHREAIKSLKSDPSNATNASEIARLATEKAILASSKARKDGLLSNSTVQAQAHASIAWGRSHSGNVESAIKAHEDAIAAHEKAMKDPFRFKSTVPPRSALRRSR